MNMTRHPGKKKKRDAAVLESRTGLRLGPEPGGFSNHPAALCFFRGLLIFCCVFGTIGCYLSSFDISFHVGLTGVFLFAMSLYASFLYYNRVTLNVGYLVLFFLFALAAFRFYRYASSGFSAILNITYDAIDEKLMLPSVRHFSEIYEDRFTSVTVVLFFIGTFLSIVFNCILSGAGRFLWLFLLTFPVIQIGLYFDRTPSLPYTILLALGWCAVLFTRREPRLRGGQKKSRRNGKAFAHSYCGGHHYTAVSSSHSFFSIGLLGSLFAAAMLSLTVLFLPPSLFSLPTSWAVLKNRTEESVRTFMISGFSSLLNRYPSAGGVNGGQLGGVGSIRPDFETDLIVDLVPYRYDTFYLKAFTGGDYGFSHWDPALELADTADELPADSMTMANRESVRLAGEFENGNPKAVKSKVRITNKGANPDYLYLPYYSSLPPTAGLPSNVKDFRMDLALGVSPAGQPYEIPYYALTSGVAAPEVGDTYSAFAFQHYLQIPDSTREDLSQICLKAGLYELFLSIPELTDRINAFFSTDRFSYSMSPGNTPKGEDFVLYFLEKQKKGFCTHFAAAATLIFRLNGFPARYVEGYVIPYSKILDSDMASGERLEDWFSGSSSLGKTAVVEVEVNDSMAHAWVEVYQNNFGWVPVEVTPPSNEPLENYSRSFWDLFVGGWSGGDTDSDGGPVLSQVGRGFTAAVGRIGRQLLLAAVSVLLLFLLFLAGKKLRRALAVTMLMRSGRYSEAVMSDYRRLVHRLCAGHAVSGQNLTCRDCFSQIRASLTPPEEELKKWTVLIERAGYGPLPLTPEEAGFCRLFHKKLLRTLRKRRPDRKSP